LERRELLAGDLLAFHNDFAPADVDQDYRISPRDALTVINYMNRYGMGSLDTLMDGKTGESTAYVDTSGDGRLDASDALSVINALNRGQGIDGELLELRIGVRDHVTDADLLDPGSRTLNIAPGEIVDLEISYNDLRFSSDAQIGAFGVFVDIFTPTEGVSFADFVEPIVTETQELVFSNLLIPETPTDPVNGGRFLFSEEGGSTVVPIQAADFAASPVDSIGSALNALGYSDDQFSITRIPVNNEIPDPPREFRIRFLGEELYNRQLPNLVVNASEVTGSSVSVETLEVAAINEDLSVNSAAIALNINTNTRSLPPTVEFVDGVPVFTPISFYSLSNFGAFGEDGYNDVGGLGQVLPEGIPNFNDQNNTVPFDAFSLPVRFKSEISNFVIQVDQPVENPKGPDDTEILLYPGDPDDRLAAANVLVDVDDDPSIAGDDRFGLVVFNVSTGLVSTPGSITLNEDLNPAGGNTIDLVALVTDINETGAPITITSVSNGANGSVDRAGSTATYTPNDDFFGSDSFTFEASNGTATTTGIVNVTVVSQNDPPVAAADAVTATRGTALLIQATELLTNDNAGPSNEAQALTITAVSGSNAVLNVNDQTITYTPPAGTAPTDNFTYTVRDAEGATATATVTVTINDQPVAPTANNFTLQGTEGEVLNFSDAQLLANVSGTAPLAIDSVSSASAGTLVDNQDGTYSYTPVNDDVFGNVATFSFVASNSLGTDSGTVTINLTGVNDAPEANDETLDVVELSGVNSLAVLANDTAGPLEGTSGITITALDTTGTVGAAEISSDGAAILFDPEQALPGTTTIGYTVTDSQGLSSQATVTVNITQGVRPRALDDSLNVEEGEVAVVDVLANDRVNTGAVPTLVGTGAIIEGSGNATVSIDDNQTPNDLTDDKVVVAPDAFFNGRITFTYSIADTLGPASDQAAATATVTVNVGPINDPPNIGADPARTTTSNVPLTIGVTELLANDDPGPNEGDQEISVTAVQATTTAGGSVVLEGTNILYTPPLNFEGTDVIRYTVSDNGDPVASSEATLTVNVTNINPTAGTDNVVAFLNFPATYSAERLLANDSAGETEQTLSIVSATALSTTQGTVTLQENGSIRFVPATDFIGNTSFQYTISDGIETTVGTVNVDVQEFQPSSISGSVFFDNILSVSNPIRDGIQSSEERGLSGVRVTATSAAADNASGELISLVGFTNLTGAFSFENLAPGRYTVVAELPVDAIDAQDTPGTLGDLDDVENQFTVDIAQPGGLDGTGYYFSLIGLRGASADTAEFFALNYLRENESLASLSNDGLEGGLASLGSDGSMQFVRVDEGFEGVLYAEIALNEVQDAALLTIINSEGEVQIARMDDSQFLVVANEGGGSVVRFFGGVEDFNFATTSDDLLKQEFSNFRDAIDEILGSGNFS